MIFRSFGGGNFFLDFTNLVGAALKGDAAKEIKKIADNFVLFAAKEFESTFDGLNHEPHGLHRKNDLPQKHRKPQKQRGEHLHPHSIHNIDRPFKIDKTRVIEAEILKGD